MRTCNQEGCSGKLFAREMCGMHYQRDKKGLPMDAPKRQARMRGQKPFNGLERKCHQCKETKRWNQFYEGMTVCMKCYRGREKPWMTKKKTEAETEALLKSIFER